MTFRGFPPECLTFYEGLELDNSKAYWTAHREQYETAVREPMRALVETLGEWGPFHVFRPNRDVRFSKDKSPYKTAMGAVGESQRGAHFYVQISAAGLMVASGYYMMAPDQLERLRAAIADPRTGPALVKIVDAARADGLDCNVRDPLKTAPRGYPKDHPRIELLRGKGLTTGRTFPVARWLHTAAVRDRVVDTWKAAKPVNRWLERHVGPSTAPPPEPT
ncbi:MAG: DUF2461 domain-containing protein [Acidimicrobiia bacterium]